MWTCEAYFGDVDLKVMDYIPQRHAWKTIRNTKLGLAVRLQGKRTLDHPVFGQRRDASVSMSVCKCFCHCLLRVVARFPALQKVRIICYTVHGGYRRI